MQKIFRILLIIIVLVTSSRAKAQTMSVKQIQDSMKVLASVIFNDLEHDFKKYEANAIFEDLLLMALEEEASFEINFDSIPFLSIQGPLDKSFRIFSWYIKTNTGNYEYFGLFQSYNSYRKRYEVIELEDQTKSINKPATESLVSENWYGCVYYNVIVQKRKRRTFYILFGWKPIGALEHQKIIEVITLKSKGVPRFGYPIFQKRGFKDKRIILKYSSQATCLLRYEDQYVHYRKKRAIPLPGILSDSPKYKDITRKKKMIIIDRLVPENPALEHQYQFYIPSGDIYDAYIFERGKFRFRENVDARNPAAPKRKQKETKKPEQGLFGKK